MSKDNISLEAKIITLGDSKVGKSSLIVKFIENKFTNDYTSTIGFDLKYKSLQLENNEVIKIIIHDTAGQERFKSLSTNYIKKANGVLLVYSITDKDSFNNISNWMNDIIDEAGDKIPIVLIGNKCDLEDNRKISKEEGENAAKQYTLFLGFVRTPESSSKNLKNN